MKLLPIDIDETINHKFWDEPECVDVLKVFTAFYKKVGFEKPWIAYFVADQDGIIVGGGAYKGKPKDGVVDISYEGLKNRKKSWPKGFQYVGKATYSIIQRFWTVWNSL